MFSKNVFHAFLKGTLCRLDSLRVTTSHSYYYKKLDEFGKNFNAPILERVKKESERLKRVNSPKQQRVDLQSPSSNSDQDEHTHPLTRPLVPLDVVLSADKGRKLVFDNFDFRQQVHGMTQDHQNVDVHWVTHLAVENRVSGNHLSSEAPSVDDLMSLENGLCLPNRYEQHLQREEYITLAERVIVEIPCLAFLKPVVLHHIPHQYSKEMASKSAMVRSSDSAPFSKYMNFRYDKNYNMLFLFLSSF